MRPYVRRSPTAREWQATVNRAKAQEHTRQRGLTGLVIGPEELENLQRKLHPGRFSAMSPKMAAIVGFILDARYTSPAIDEMASDGFVVMASHEGEVGMNYMLGSVKDLESNWEKLLDAADLTFEERAHAQQLFWLKIEGAAL